MYFPLHLRNIWDIPAFNECLRGFESKCVLKKEIIKIWLVYMLFLFPGFLCMFQTLGSVRKINA